MLHGQRTSLVKTIAHNPAAIYIVLEVEEEIVGFIGQERQRDSLHITVLLYYTIAYRFLNVITLLKALEKIARALIKKRNYAPKPACRIQKLLSSIEKRIRVVGTKEELLYSENEVLWKCSMHAAKNIIFIPFIKYSLQDYIQRFSGGESLVTLVQRKLRASK